MLPVEAARADDPRARAARTKRDRTRAALLAAGDAAFGSHGWARTRMEDIAAAAGVSTATAYNHFPTKHALIGHVYRPLVTPLRVQAEQDIAAGRPATDALADQIHGLIRLTWRHRILSGAFFVATQEYAERVGAAARDDDELDPRTIAGVPDAIRILVAHGQQSGELRALFDAADVSSMTTNLMLIRCIEAPDEAPETTAELFLTMLWGGLRPVLQTHPTPST